MNIPVTSGILGLVLAWGLWLVWVAVDIVGVPLLVSAGYYASAFMYVFYGCFTLLGFFIWWRVQRREGSAPVGTESSGVEIETAFPDVTVRLSSADDEARR